MNDGPKTERWLTRAEAAERLRVVPSTIDYYVSTGRLTRYTLPPAGKGTTGTRPSPRYRIEDVDALARPEKEK